MNKTYDSSRLKNLKRADKHLYYLNDYLHPTRALRIESTRGGERCLWKERTTLKKMEQTKRFLEKSWGIE